MRRFYNVGHKELLMKAKKKTKIPKKTLHKTPPSVKKSLGELMKDEDGFVSKETILKVGLSTVAALGITGALTDISSGQNDITHNNTVTPNGNCVDHTNITTHSSY